MKVKLLIARAGVDFTQNAGDEVEVSAEEGKRLIEAGQAAPVRENTPEKAVRKKTAEKAV